MIPMRTILLPLILLALLPAAAVAQDPAPQSSVMIHMDGAGGSLRFIPARVVVTPGATVQLMIFGQDHGLYSFTLDDDPSREALVDTSSPGTVHTAEFAAPDAPGEYAFHDRHHPQARGVLVVMAAGGAPAAAGVPVEVGVGDGYDTRFHPDRIEVEAGARFTFRNNGSAIVHTFRLEDAILDTKTVRPGEERELVAPSKPGEYPFVCEFHADSGMRGVLVVREAAAGAGPTPTNDPGSGPSESTATRGDAPAPRETPGLPAALVVGVLALVGLLVARKR